jgi:choline dehydrogenase-like flavoprotein
VSYDVAIVGTGFAGAFFLLRLLETRPHARVIVLERGRRNDHAWQIEHRQNSDIVAEDVFRRTGDAHKTWNFTIGFGGGSNCWWGNTPRMLPADFAVHSRYGVGRDWPLGYDDLAPWYERAEQVMAIAGASDAWPFPRSGPYPQPPHHFNDPERLLKRAYPEAFFANPTARARIATETRPSCCANGVCNLCPIQAKFTVAGDLGHLYEDPRVTLVLGADVQAVEMQGGRARAVVYRQDGAEHRAEADLVVLGANAMFNPAILLRSGIEHPLLGRRLHEQVGVVAEAHLAGLDSFQGSTSVTGHGYMLYADDARRREKAACLIETWNVGLLRPEPGKWRQVLPLRLVIEDLPSDENRVALDGDMPRAEFAGHSDYALRAVRDVHADLERVLSPLPLERLVITPTTEPTESHILGTTVMGRDAGDSVVDRDGLHHTVRNLVVLGGSLFPSGAPANPTLTIAALALRSADHLFA